MKAKPRFRDGGIESIVDPALEGDYNAEVFSDMTNVALVCASFSKTDRPSMKVCDTRIVLMHIYERKG